METTVKERIVQFLKFKRIGQNKFENICGLSNGYVSNLRNSPSVTILQRILNGFPELNPDWLMKGEGEMLMSEKKDSNKDAIPLIPVNAVGGYLSGTSDAIMDYDCDMYTMPLFRGADFLIKVEGDSMMPKYMPGDIVACKKVEGRLWFQWGKVYVVDTKQGALIKRIEPADEDGCICLCSENEKYKPFKLYAEDINGVALVKGVIRVE